MLVLMVRSAVVVQELFPEMAHRPLRDKVQPPHHLALGHRVGRAALQAQPPRNHVLVLVSAVHAPTLKALGVAP